MDIKQLSKIKTPDGWINDAVSARLPVRRGISRRAVCIAVICIIIITLTVAVSAAVPSFSDWLGAQLGSNAVVTGLYGYEITEDGFFIKDGEISRLENGRLIKLDVKSVSGARELDGKTYDFSFDYVINGEKIHVTRKSDNVVSVTSFNETCAIVWLDMGSVWNSYFTDLKSGGLRPIVKDGVAESGRLKLATDVEVSPDKRYLLYRSNRYTSKTDGNKGEWFVQDRKTGAEVRLEKVPTELFSKEIGFIDGTHIAVSYNGQERPMVYDCRTNEYTVITGKAAGEFADTLISQKGYRDGKYIFEDLYTGKTYYVQSKSGNNTVIVTRELICIMAPDGDAAVYLIDRDKTVRFETGIADGALTDVRKTGKSSYLFITENAAFAVTYK